MQLYVFNDSPSQSTGFRWVSKWCVITTIYVMSNETSNGSRPRRVTKSHPIEVEISDLTFDDVTKAARSDGGVQSAQIPTPTGRTVEDVMVGEGVTDGLESTVAHRFDFSSSSPSQAGGLDRTSYMDHETAGGGAPQIIGGEAQSNSGAGASIGMEDDRALTVMSSGGPVEVKVVGWKVGSVLGWSCFKGIVWGIIWALVLVLASVAVDKMGLLEMVNSLMGEAMRFDLGKMIKLDLVAGVVLGVFVMLLNFFNMMFLNAYAGLIGPLKAKVVVTWKRPSASKDEKSNTGE